jgi:hypothetical protein
MHCLNCGQLVSENFCSVCGQKTTVKRISIKALLHDLPHSLFHVDKGILKNIKGIAYPHDTVFGYMEGKRISYFSPFLFFLITTTAVLLFTYFFPISGIVYSPIETATGEEVNVAKYVDAYQKYVYLLAVFVYALPSVWLFKRESGFNFAEHVIVNLFVFSWANCIYLLLIYIPFNKQFPINVIMLLSTLVLYGLTFRHPNKTVRWFKALLIVFLQTMIYFLINIILVLIVTAVLFPEKIFRF